MKRYIGIIIFFFTACSLHAQTENNSERLITQLKNGTAPGLQFAKNVTVPTVKAAPAVVPAMATAKIQQTSNLPLASEQEIRKEQTTIVAAPPVIPSQEEKKKE